MAYKYMWLWFVIKNLVRTLDLPLLARSFNEVVAMGSHDDRRSSKRPMEPYDEEVERRQDPGGGSR